MIAQTYRPKTLDEIIGHDKIVKEIKDRFIKNVYPQVSYFTGISGGGKTTFAYNIAKVIQCKNKVNQYTPCNQCSQCKDINKESFINGTYMFNASNLDIEAMRYIEELSTSTSFVSDKKVIIIDEFQELNSNKKAQKNLLKALEKESKDLYFILLSMDDSKVDRSIKNRSVTYKLYPIEYSKIAEYLYNICSLEKIELDESKTDILFTIAENSNGSVRQSCAYLERVIQGSLWDKESLEQTLHFVNNNTVNELCLKIINQDPTLFENEINEEVLQKIKTTFIDLFKSIIGYNLEPYKKKLLEGLLGYKKINTEKLNYIIDTLNETFKYPYLNKEIIDSILIKLFLNKEQVSITKNEIQVENEQPKKRRQQ
jgi:DNA polymerase-3 subunit gamma/tau